MLRRQQQQETVATELRAIAAANEEKEASMEAALRELKVKQEQDASSLEDTLMRQLKVSPIEDAPPANILTLFLLFVCE